MGIWFEATHRPPEFPLLVLYAGMIGLPEYAKATGGKE